MDLELHQLELRYEELRSRHPARERRLVASLAEIGQQTPIIIVAGADVQAGWFVVVDGYKRVRGLRRLGSDVIRATLWELGEPEALVMERLLRAGDVDSPLEQGWLLRELIARFGLTAEELARRFDRSASWVSTRLGLVGELPEEIQSLVRSGAIGAHGAMKYLVPFARANRADCVRLAEAIRFSPASPPTGAACGQWAGFDLSPADRVSRHQTGSVFTSRGGSVLPSAAGPWSMPAGRHPDGG